MTSEDAEPKGGIAAAFAHVAEARPSQTAVGDDGGQMSFGELAGLAGGLAHELGKGAPVIVLPADGRDLAASVLGTLCAGRTVVVLGSGSPASVVTDAMHATGADVVVGSVPIPGVGAPRLLPEHVTPRPMRPAPVKPSDVFAIALTSGSTGPPKAVPRSHASLLETRVDPSDPARLAPGDHLGLVLSSSSVVTSNLLRALIGGYPVSCFDVARTGPLGMATGIRRHGVTVLHVVPTVLRRMIDATPPDTRLPTLRIVRCGGEPLLWTDVARARAHLAPTCRIVNTYGTTEVGGIASRVVTSDEPIGRGTVPVGRPIRDVDVWIDDGDGQPAPPGAAGEIVVEGPGVSRRMLRSTPPAGNVDPAGSRYRTGDLGRLDDDGDLEHLGRLDRMIKIGGMRIEPGQVEDVLRRHPGVRDVGVTSQPDGRGEHRLIAHVTTAPQDRPTTRALRQTALDALPPQSVPALFVLRDDPLPMLPSGKTDFHTLAKEIPDRPVLDVPWVAPDGEEERMLARAFEEVLDVTEVGATDDFFLLGGDSLRAARLCALILERTGIDLPTSVLLEAPTVAQLARGLATGGRGAWRCVVPLRDEGDEIPLFIAHGQFGNVIGARRLASLLAPGRPVYGIQAETLDGRPPRARTIPDMAARYVGEILTTRPQGPYLLFGFSFGGWIALEIARQLRSTGHEVPLVILGDTARPSAGQAQRVPDEENGGELERRIARHRINLEEGDRGALSYLGWRIKTRLARASRRTSLALWSLTGRPLPPRLRPAGVQRACRRALATHQISPYDGRVVLLRTPSPEPEPDRGWSRALGTTVEVVSVPGTHNQLLGNPAAADAIENCIAEADALEAR